MHSDVICIPGTIIILRVHLTPWNMRKNEGAVLSNVSDLQHFAYFYLS